jgi:cysteine-rich repeat protein
MNRRCARSSSLPVVAVALIIVAFCQTAHAAATCGNGVREAPDEACDDGNVFSGDGCNVTCGIEDFTQDVWLCDAPVNATTSCCPSLVNPVTLNRTCSCLGQVNELPALLLLLLPLAKKSF